MEFVSRLRRTDVRSHLRKRQRKQPTYLGKVSTLKLTFGRRANNDGNVSVNAVLGSLD